MKHLHSILNLYRKYILFIVEKVISIKNKNDADKLFSEFPIIKENNIIEFLEKKITPNIQKQIDIID